MADEKTEMEITPLKLETILSKKPELKYDLSRYTASQKRDILNNMCDLMMKYGLPTERCDDLMFFRRAVPDHLIPMIELSSKIYDLAERQNTTFKDIVTGIVAQADTVFSFPEEFPNSAYLLHAIYTHGLKEGKHSGDIVKRGLKRVESLVNAQRDIGEEVNDYAQASPKKRNSLLNMLKYK